MKATQETVTPKKAMDWLKLNVANRPMSATHVNHLAKAMELDKWKVNGDCVRFNGSGNLIDGQHRLTACVQSGKPFDTYVVRGLEHDAFDTIDQGKKRDISDVFARQGHRRYAALAASVRWFWRYRNDFAKQAGGMRPDEANEILKKHPGIIASVEEAARIYQSQRRIITQGLLGFLVFMSSSHDDSLPFWESVVSGEGLKGGSPGLLLHKRLVDNLASVARLSQETICAFCIKAWNAYRAGDSKVKILKFAENEEFPKFSK